MILGFSDVDVWMLGQYYIAWQRGRSGYAGVSTQAYAELRAGKGVAQLVRPLSAVRDEDAVRVHRKLIPATWFKDNMRLLVQVDAAQYDPELPLAAWREAALAADFRGTLVGLSDIEWRTTFLWFLGSAFAHNRGRGLAHGQAPVEAVVAREASCTLPLAERDARDLNATREEGRTLAAEARFAAVAQAADRGQAPAEPILPWHREAWRSALRARVDASAAEARERERTQVVLDIDWEHEL